MKFCSHCGKELLDEAVICTGCGCAVSSQQMQVQPVYQQPAVVQDPGRLLQTLSQRLNINGIIWLVIGVLQILGGIFWDWWLLIVGVLNVISAIQDMQYSKAVLADPCGIVPKFEPLVGPIITLIYNLVIGGVIGVVGSIYYFLAIRNYVMENRAVFEAIDAANSPSTQQPPQS